MHYFGFSNDAFIFFIFYIFWIILLLDFTFSHLLDFTFSHLLDFTFSHLLDFTFSLLLDFTFSHLLDFWTFVFFIFPFRVSFSGSKNIYLYVLILYVLIRPPMVWLKKVYQNENVSLCYLYRILYKTVYMYIPFHYTPLGIGISTNTI